MSITRAKQLGTITSDSNDGVVPGSLAKGALKGWSIKENAGSPAAASITLRDGSETGDILGHIVLAASGVSNFHIDDGIQFSGAGVYVDWIAGSVTGVVYIAE